MKSDFSAFSSRGVLFFKPQPQVPRASKGHHSFCLSLSLHFGAGQGRACNFVALTKVDCVRGMPREVRLGCGDGLVKPGQLRCVENETFPPD